jgi:hypothetical protein
VDHVAGIEDCQVALAITIRAACERSPGAPITLRHGARVMPGGSPGTSGVATRKRATSPDDNQMTRNPNLA